MEIASAYDAEADYLANILSVITNGTTMDFLHPGIPVTYLSAFLIKTFNFIDTVEEIILSSRFVLLFLNLTFIYIGSRLILKQSLTISLFLFTILLIFPSGFLMVGHLSPNSILFGLAIMIIALGHDIGKRYSLQKLIILSACVGLSVSIKYTSILLALPFLCSSLFLRNTQQVEKVSSIKTFTYFTVFSGFFFSLFAWPTLPLVPFVLTQLSIFNPILGFIFDLNVTNFLVISFLGLIIAYMAIRLILKTKFPFELVYRRLFLVLLLLSLTLTTYNFFIWDQYTSLGYALRNFIPFIAIIVLFIPKLEQFLPLKITQPLFVALLFSTLLAFKIYFNFTTYQIAIDEDKDFNNFLDEVSQNYDYLVFAPIDRMRSKDLFLVWSDYRYGDRKTSFINDEKKIPFTIKDRIEKMRIFNSRSFNLESPLEKFSYKYFSFILTSNLFSKSQKKVAGNQLDMLFKKDFCTELFKDYSRGRSALIIFPSSLASYAKDNDTMKPDLALPYLEELESDFQQKCNLSTENKKVFFKDQQYYLFSIR